MDTIALILSIMMSIVKAHIKKSGFDGTTALVRQLCEIGVGIAV